MYYDIVCNKKTCVGHNYSSVMHYLYVDLVAHFKNILLLDEEP